MDRRNSGQSTVICKDACTVADKKSHPVRNSIIATLATAAILSFVTFVIPHGWHTIFSAVGSFFGWFVKTTAIPNWLLVILALSTLTLIVRTILILIANSGLTEHVPGWPTEMTIFGIHWRWKYSVNGRIHDLASFCPQCDFQIYARPASTFGRLVYPCEDCNWQSEPFDCSPSEVESRVTRKIQQHLRQELRQRYDNNG